MKTYVVSAIVIIAIAAIAYLLVTNDKKDANDAMGQEESMMVDDKKDGEMMMLESSDVEADIVGRWKSTDDAKSVVIYKADGTVEEEYDGEVLATGTWELYADAEAEYNPSSVFLRTNINDDVYEYAVLDAGEEKLSVSYLSRGNTLEYTRTDGDAMLDVDVEASVQ